MLAEKIKNIQALLRTQHIDTLFIGNMDHQTHDDLLYYLLQTHLELGIMTIPQKGIPTLYAIPFEQEELQRMYTDIRVLPLQERISTLIKKLPKKRIGYRPSSLPSMYKKSGMIALKDEESIMAKKLPKERQLLKKAAQITDIIFADVVKQWASFQTEQDVATYIILKTIEYGAEPSFSPIVASGTRAANPHHTPEAKKLVRGFCVIDMGVRYRGYCSDMTRTIYIGAPTKKESEVYNHLRKVQQKAIASCTIQTTISDIATQCRTDLVEKLNAYFVHSLGHGLGTQVHEWPRISTNVQARLEEHMYITIEPGIYIPGKLGIRIEDDVLITKKGPLVYTTTSKELILV
ncbi:MAG: hypothetical protein COU32_04160 [Candidatus Magasanikbacteria bacterium CG10_big_fil_rev_8_21_14_0_10_42_10]|uniref:Peptidase M24 domain-containing protein n=2 Tax=Candidatus Magasanikiibacteriota TaxID=1752731 RepID=A0A2H0TV68_9BACT|nr:MAG: hypothetical protein COU32_04160 [Candidatus Magasanikbacteria bacterium CG10_big_fil_rev_8_21_14_0_10_42_10]PIZ94373.1 MAG: hypothetical protein COX82_00820 [Candidatus Magasanikbacteria bacterium CG_4_10_14_0_2_um_filter_41_10]